jgi:predicted type IV restriction endonuclease
MLNSVSEDKAMATAKDRIIHKHFRLDALKLKRAQKVLDARTETETVERALDLAISEHERNRLTAEANRKFVRSGVVIRDVFGTLAE